MYLSIYISVYLSIYLYRWDGVKWHRKDWEDHPAGQEHNEVTSQPRYAGLHFIHPAVDSKCCMFHGHTTIANAACFMAILPVSASGQCSVITGRKCYNCLWVGAFSFSTYLPPCGGGGGRNEFKRVWVKMLDAQKLHGQIEIIVKATVLPDKVSMVAEFYNVLFSLFCWPHTLPADWQVIVWDAWELGNMFEISGWISWKISISRPWGMKNFCSSWSCCLVVWKCFRYCVKVTFFMIKNDKGSFWSFVSFRWFLQADSARTWWPLH